MTCRLSMISPQALVLPNNTAVINSIKIVNSTEQSTQPCKTPGPTVGWIVLLRRQKFATQPVAMFSLKNIATSAGGEYRSVSKLRLLIDIRIATSHWLFLLCCKLGHVVHLSRWICCLAFTLHYIRLDYSDVLRNFNYFTKLAIISTVKQTSFQPAGIEKQLALGHIWYPGED